MSKIVNWWLNLVELLGMQNGDNTVVEVEVPEADPDSSGDDEQEEEGDVEAEDEDVDVDDGNIDGKDRSKFIPRYRFDQVNEKAKKAERLVELGILEEDENGDFHVSQKVLEKSEPKTKSSDSDFRFTKDDVDDASWPLVEKINKGHDFISQQRQSDVAMFTHAIQALQSENAILRDYPEFLQKDGELRKRALDLLKNDSEFKTTYKNNPQKGYYAVKRASELLGTKQPAKKVKSKSKFIVGRGDGGKEGKKMVPLESLTGEQLDDLERKEHERIESSRK